MNQSSLPANLLAIVLAHPAIPRVLRAISTLNPPLPNVYLAGGCIRNTVWNSLFKDSKLKINDFDIGFYDPIGDRAQESRAKEALTAHLPDLAGTAFDVKNQYSFGKWRPTKDGRIVDYASVEDGIADFVHTATSVGVRIEGDTLSKKEVPRTVLLSHKGTNYRIVAPHGLEDLFEGIVRPVPSHRDSKAAREKGPTYLAACPSLKLLPPL